MSKLLTLTALALAASCASTSGSALGGSDSKLITFARGLNVIPASPRACPGDVIETTYQVRIAGGTNLPLTESDVASLVRRGVAAEPTRNGNWQTSDGLASAKGFRLSAALGRDTSVRGDTLIVPEYGCRPIRWDLRDPHTVAAAHVRLGVVATPFYDSVVVAVLEVPSRSPITAIVGPAQMRSVAIHVNATGADGRPGRPGQSGSDGGECEAGGDGSDGDAGGDGQPGGQVDIIVQAGSEWLADLVSVSNAGGHAGSGGRGGSGGRAGAATRGSTKSCSPKNGRPGQGGPSGRNGDSGSPPKVTSIPLALLWSGSPIWTDSASRQALSELIQFTLKAGR